MYDGREEVEVMQAVVTLLPPPPPRKPAPPPPKLFLTSDSFALFSPWWVDVVGRSIKAIATQQRQQQQQGGGGGGPPRPPKRVAAYIGANNSDLPELFGVFESCVDRLGLGLECQHLIAKDADADALCRVVTERAALVLIAGGDYPSSGWRFIKQSGLDDAIKRAHRAGTVVVGVADGAALLGPHSYSNEALSDGLSPTPFTTFPTFGMLPYLVGVNEEKELWKQAECALMMLAKEGVKLVGLGLPKRGAVAIHADGSIEPSDVALQALHSTARQMWSLPLPMTEPRAFRRLLDDLGVAGKNGEAANELDPSVRPKLGLMLEPGSRYELSARTQYVTLLKSFEREIVFGPHEAGAAPMLLNLIR